jgi:DNA-binding SARP family transcriptional activator
MVENVAETLEPDVLDASLDRLEGWLDRLRGQRHGHPWLVYLEARVASHLCRDAAAEAALADARRAFLEHLPPGPARDRALARVALGQAVLAERTGHRDAARQAFEAARELLGASAVLPDEIAAGEAARWRADDPSGAAGFWIEAAAAAHAAGDRALVSRAFHNLALEMLRRGEAVPAARLANAACELKRDTAGLAGYGNSLNVRGMALRLLGRLAAAADDLEEACALARTDGHRTLAAYALNNLAEVNDDEGDVDLADARFAEAAAEKEAMGDTFGLAYTFRCWARLRRRCGDLERAARLAEWAWRLRQPTPRDDEHALLRLELALTNVASGDSAAAARHARSARDAARRSAAVAARLAAEGVLAHLRGDTATAGRRQDELSNLGHHPLAVDLGALTCSAQERRSQKVRVCARLLGEFSLEVGGVRLDVEPWRNRRAAELLRALCANRHRWVTRDELLEWLWPGQPAEATRSLQTAVALVRHGIESLGGSRETLSRDGDRYRIVLDACDADSFTARLRAAEQARRAGRSRLAQARLDDALALWRGTAALPADLYADWSREPREELAALAQQARLQCADAALHEGRLDAALARANEALAVDPLCGAAHRVAVRAHVRRGNLAAAHRSLSRLSDPEAAHSGLDPDDMVRCVLDDLGSDSVAAEALRSMLTVEAMPDIRPVRPRVLPGGRRRPPESRLGA